MASSNRDDVGAGSGDEDHHQKQQQPHHRPRQPPPMRNSAIKRSAAAVTTLALLALAASAVAASAAAPSSSAPSSTLDVAPAPGAVMAVPPPPSPAVLAPSEAAERFARSLVLESVGDDNEGAPGAASAGSAEPPAAAAGAGDGELLRWAISHSDPAALREAAKKAQDLTVEERRQRVAELRAVMEGGGLRSDTDLMKAAVKELSAFLEGGEGVDVAAARAALERLADLAQSIDNANDLRPLGALAPLAALIDANGGKKGTATVDPSLRAAAARCVGVAASNNVRFQGDLLAAEPRAVAHLLEAVGRQNDDEKLRLPALFAASTFARSASPASREAFFSAAGVPRLVELLGEEASRRYPQLALNAAVLLGDLADLGAAGDDGGALVAAVGGEGESGSGSGTWRALAEGVLRTVGGADSAPTSVDKALSAVRALSGLEPGRLALVAAGGEERMAAAAAEVAAAGGGGGGAEYRQYLSELASELREQLRAGGDSDQLRSEL
jgi:hypothetical protein